MTRPSDPPAEPAAADRSALLRDDQDVPLMTASLWQQAEARLYPAVTTRPDLYQRVVTIVRLTVDRLRELGPSTGALLAAAERGPGLVGELLVENGLPSYELDLELVAQAALAMRHREVVAEQASRRRLRLVAEGRRAGRSWVVLEEKGPSDGDVYIPYTRLEVEVRTGRALLITARADEEFRTVLHAVEQVRLDLVTGAVEPADDAVAPVEHARSSDREEYVTTLRGHPREA